MDDDRSHVPRESPYRQSGQLPAVEGFPEITPGVVSVFVVLIIVLVNVLSVEPEGNERFGGLDAWEPARRAHATPHP